MTNSSASPTKRPAVKMAATMSHAFGTGLSTAPVDSVPCLHSDHSDAPPVGGSGSAAGGSGSGWTGRVGGSGFAIVVGGAMGDRANPGPSSRSPFCAAGFHSLIDSTCRRQNRLSSSVSTAPDSHSQPFSDWGSASSACPNSSLACALRPDMRAAMPSSISSAARRVSAFVFIAVTPTSHRAWPASASG